MKIINMDGYSREELLAYKPHIFRNLIESMKQVLIALQQLNVKSKIPETLEYSKLITEYEFDYTMDTFPHDLLEAINYLWIMSGIRNLFTRLIQVNYIIDSAPYFFNQVERIARPDYIPTVTDVLKARVKTTGISETKFKMGNIAIRMLDVGGQRMERSKWIRGFENVPTVIFCVALSEYDMVLLEDESQNRMLESFVVFESVVNSKWFSRSSIVLFLNKTDIFKQKLTYSPLKRCFPEFTGGDDFDSAAEFIKQKFLSLNHSGVHIYPHLTCATDTSQIEFVFSAVKETILTKALKETGLL